MYTEHLENIGLTAHQAAAYESLIEHGPLPASKLARRTGIERSLIYHTLNELIDLDLVVRDDSKKIAYFKPLHPKSLEKLVQEKESSSKVAHASLESVFFQLQQAFEIQTGQPGIRFHAGVEGLKVLFKKINEANPKEIFLIRSIHAEETTDMMEVVDAQIREQIKRKIKVNVITPSLPIVKSLLHKDTERLTERRIIAKEVFNTPSQILIYNDVVAITTYRDPVVTTVIEHEDIATTMLSLFTYIWRQSRAETDSFIKKFTEK